MILFLISCGKEEKAGFKTYTNDEQGFTLSYPETWGYREGFAKDSETATGTIVIFQAPYEGKKDIFRENAVIFNEELPDSVKDVDSYFEYSQEYLPTQLEDLEIKDSGKRIVNGTPARWLIFQYTNRLQRVTALGYMFYHNDKGLVITSTARPEDFMRWRRTFEDIATSIEFN
jgi:hypothetical protein